ncbi:MAG: cupin domain-containing protein [Chloroflexi bacterium]|nr:cupin domain-containing protein [Chloroflexota bacterium]
MPRGARDEDDTRREVNVGEIIRRDRERHGLSVRTLAAETGFSASFISQVELGQVSPSIASLSRIAAALGITLSDLFSESTREVARVVKSCDRPRLISSWSRAQIEALTPTISTNLESVMLTIAPGGHSGKYENTHGGEIFAIVFEGEVTLTLGREAHALGSGDAVTIDSRTHHYWENTGLEPVKIVIVSSRFRL